MLLAFDKSTSVRRLLQGKWEVLLWRSRANMPAGPLELSHSLPMPVQSRIVPPGAAGLSLAPPTSSLEQPQHQEQHLDLVPHSADSGSRMKSKEEELESKSISSDNQDGGSGDEQDMAGQRRSKKRYHRHTQHQIQEMERLFKECPHPDEKARLELSRELNLDPRQVKFWFQNKRTQMKAQQERMDNSYLRNENEKLKSENAAFRDAIRNVLCSNCGGPAANNADGMAMEDEHLRIENAKLKEEVSRLSALASKQVVARPNPVSSPPTSSTELGLNNISPLLSELAATGPSVAEIASRPLCLTDTEKHMVVELAVSAMEELAQVAQASEPLWVPDLNTGCELLNQQAYIQQFHSVIGSTPYSLKVEASRQTDMVIMSGPSLVETLMNVDRWTEMFPSIISKAQIVEALSTGAADPFDGAMQLMYAELQLPSPFVPTREVYFLRYSKRVDHLWLVVDVSVDSLRGNPPPSLLRCRKRPSGCVIEETANSSYSKVTWVEHVEVEDKEMHPSYQALVSSGLGFGARRWLASLQRQCERLASLLTDTPFLGRDAVLPSSEGRRSILKLAERMSNNFCGGVSASPRHLWITLSSGGGGAAALSPPCLAPSSSPNIGLGSGAGAASCDECRVVIRKSVDDPGRPPGIVLSAATSLWLPVSPSRVFQFLRDERYRTEWDILSNMGLVEEMVRVPKGQDPGNSVSLLKVNAANSNQSNMLILQDCRTDRSCSSVVYAPVDVGAMGAVLNGGDPGVVLLLPSGFAILPDGPHGQQTPSQQQGYRRAADASSASSPTGCLLTVAFQILVDHVPTAKLSLESVATVNNLISSTVLRIKSALCGVDNHPPPPPPPPPQQQRQ